MAARGARETDHGVERLEDPELVAYFRQKVKGVYVRTFFATLALVVLSRAWHWFYSPQ